MDDIGFRGVAPSTAAAGYFVYCVRFQPVPEKGVNRGRTSRRGTVRGTGNTDTEPGLRFSAAPLAAAAEEPSALASASSEAVAVLLLRPQRRRPMRGASLKPLVIILLIEAFEFGGGVPDREPHLLKIPLRRSERDGMHPGPSSCVTWTMCPRRMGREGVSYSCMALGKQQPTEACRYRHPRASRAARRGWTVWAVFRPIFKSS